MKKIILFKLLVVFCVSSLITSISVAADIKITDLEQSQNKTSESTDAKSDAEKPEKNVPELKALYKTQNLTPEAALVVAQAAMKNCRDSGYQVSVVIVDKGGVIQVLLRDRLAGIKTPDIAILKAQTALSFKESTSSLANSLLKNKHLAAIKDAPGVLFLAGGIPISAAGSIIGAIGISGAPDSKFDERCAIIGLKPIKGMLDFAD